MDDVFKPTYWMTLHDVKWQTWGEVREMWRAVRDWVEDVTHLGRADGEIPF